jgi:hypothetical protein
MKKMKCLSLSFLTHSNLIIFTNILADSQKTGSVGNTMKTVGTWLERLQASMKILKLLLSLILISNK